MVFMYKRTKGIVLKNTIFGEADLIVTHLTRDFGVLQTFAKSPRKVKSRFGSSLEPLSYSTISFFGKEDANLPRLTQSDIILPFHSLRADFNCFVGISELLELCLSFLPAGEAQVDVFDLLLATLLQLQSNCNHGLCCLYYKIRFLEIAGYSPRLDVCGRCGRTASGKGHRNFYISQGSILCYRCVEIGNASVSLSDSAIKVYKSLAAWHAMALSRIRPPEDLLKELTHVINSHINYILVRPLKSYSSRLLNGAEKKHRAH